MAGRPRVVSLLPSATEMVCAVGGRGFLVGRSHECDYPAGLGGVPVLTRMRTDAGVAPAEVDASVRTALSSGASLYDLFADQLLALRPDVILTQDVCEVCSVDLAAVRRVADGLSHRPEVVSLNPATVEGVLDDVLTVARAVGLEPAGRDVVVGLRERMCAAEEHVNAYAARPVLAFLEWTDPLYCGGHWTAQLVERAGAAHPLNPTRQGVAGKSVRVPEEVMTGLAPEWVVICPCGMDLARTRGCAAALAAKNWWGALPAVANGRVALVDGNQMFNRPGPRLVDAFEWLVGWLHGREELMPRGFPWEAMKTATGNGIAGGRE